MNCFHGDSHETFQEAPVLQRQPTGMEEEEFAHFLLRMLLPLKPAEPFPLGRDVPHMVNLNPQPPRSPRWEELRNAASHRPSKQARKRWRSPTSR